MNSLVRTKNHHLSTVPSLRQILRDTEGVNSVILFCALYLSLLNKKGEFILNTMTLSYVRLLLTI